MAVNPIPPGFHSVTPYLDVPDVLKLLSFLQQAFDASVVTPPIERPDGSVGHAAVRIGDSEIMMGSATDGFEPTRSMVHLYVPDADAVYQKALDAGASPVQPISEQWYGDRSGGVIDSDGNLWWIATRTEDLSEEELAQRIKNAMAA
jgi:uncharacterized glyoxalase superfamily protein PhnB